METPTTPLAWTTLLLLALSTMSLLVGVSGEFTLTILHTNDVHARVEEINKYDGRCSASNAAKNECYGGMARLKTKVDEMRSKYGDTSLLLDAGDQFQGSLFFYVHGGGMVADFMNKIGYDAMALGNHEFDEGVKGLKPFLGNASFEVLGSNIDFSMAPELSKIHKSYVIERGSGEKIGIIGFITKETAISSKPGVVKFKDEVTSIQAEVDALKKKGVTKIIALGHAGYIKDKEIASKVRGLDVIVGGHSNTFLYNGPAPAQNVAGGPYPTVVKNPDGDNVLIVQAYAYGKYLGFLQVTFDDQGTMTNWSGNPILMDHTVTKDASILQAIDEYRPALAKVDTERLGTSLVHLDASRKICRLRECNMGNMVADAMVRQNLRYTNSMSWNHVAIALMNAGSLRASIVKGEIKPTDVFGLMPFRNTMDILQLSGKDLLRALEQSVVNWNPKDLYGGFLQMSGIRVVYDISRPINQRVVTAQARCADCPIPKFETIENHKIYPVLISSFLSAGGDGFEVFKEQNKTSLTIGDLDSQIVIDYIKANSPIASGVDGRIQFLEDIQTNVCLSSAPVRVPLTATATLLTLSMTAVSIIVSMVVV